MNSILTVTTPASSYDLTLVATVRTELGITNNDEDTKITGWIRQASATIAKHCNRVFASETLTETFRGVANREILQLTRWPVSSITSITLDDDEAALDSAADYEFDGANGHVFRLVSDLRTNWVANKIVVVYVAGYTLLAELPYDIERAAILLVKQYRFSAKRDPLIKSVDVFEVQRTDYVWGGSLPGSGADLPAEVEQLINPYCDYNFG
jgi:hypothetical protein